MLEAAITVSTTPARLLPADDGNQPNDQVDVRLRVIHVVRRVIRVANRLNAK